MYHFVRKNRGLRPEQFEDVFQTFVEQQCRSNLALVVLAEMTQRIINQQMISM